MTTRSDGEWRRLDTGAGAPQFNMAFDEALLEAATVNAVPVLRFYSWSAPAATFGYFQRHAEVAAATPLRPLIRRPTGGGLVPHVWDWTYSIVIPPGHEWYGLSAVESYRRLHEWVQRALGSIGIETALAPCCDPAGPGQCFVGAEKFDLLAGRTKVAGAAQRRNKLGLLIQGSIQPLASWGERTTWQDAMTQVGSRAGAAERFVQEAPPESVALRAAELIAVKYGQTAYHERR